MPITSRSYHLSVAVDSSGDILIAGVVGADFDGESFFGGNSDAVVMKVSQLGSVMWSRLIGTNGDEVAYGGKRQTIFSQACCDSVRLVIHAILMYSDGRFL